MKKIWIVIAVIVIVALGAAAWWFMTNKATAPSSSSSSSTSDTTNTNTTNSTTDVASGEVNIEMKDTAFSKTSVTIKKGTKVTWTNQDSVRHNVVADSSNAAGLPTDNALLSKGDTYSFTFNTVGTVKYHCTPHPFMTGTIEVVD